MPAGHSLRAALAAAVVFAALSVQPASAAPGLRVGIVEHAHAFYGDPDRLYPILRQLRADVLRVNLNWGGQIGVARRRPEEAFDPRDPAYDWRIYDRAVIQAERHGIDVVFSIFGTPKWANNGRPPNRAPLDPGDLEAFAFAAATRYSGTFRRRDGRVLPAVRSWLAWNEPNLTLGLVPQFRRVRGRWVAQSAIDYAQICNAVYEGIHATALRGEKVACGVTAPRGNNAPGRERPSISPLAFLRAMKKAGAKRFDAYAHQAYYGGPSESPTTKPRGRTAVTLANIQALIRELTRLYGRRPRLWITEYGYQTRPPDPIFGVSWARQAQYLTQAFTIARRHPRIDMMLWFLLRDERRLAGWQSGLFTATGKKKPAFAAFQRLRR